MANPIKRLFLNSNSFLSFIPVNPQEEPTKEAPEEPTLEQKLFQVIKEQKLEKEEKLEKVKILLNQSLNLEARDEKGLTALMVSVKEKQNEIALFLLERGTNPNASGNKREKLNCIELAIKYKNHSIIEPLIDHGAELDPKGDEVPALMFATMLSDAIAAEICIRRGSKVDYKGLFSPLWMAAREECAAIVKLLLDAGANVDPVIDPIGNPLIVACRRKNVEVVRLLVDHGAKVKVEFKGLHSMTTPLTLAVDHGIPEIVQILVDAGADVNYANENGKGRPIGIACRNGNFEIFKILYKAGAQVEIKDYLIAASKGHLEIVQFFVEEEIFHVDVTNIGEEEDAKEINDGTDILNKEPLNTSNDEEYPTALFFAALKDRTETVSYLLSQGADPNFGDRTGMTPFLAATASGQVETVKEFLEYRNEKNEMVVDIGRVTLEGKNAYHFAAAEGTVELAEVLAQLDIPDKKSDGKDIPDRHGNTPIVHAIWHDNEPFAKHLMTQGVNLVLEVNMFGLDPRYLEMPDLKRSDRANLIYLAAFNGHGDLLPAIILEDPNVDESWHGCTALMEITHYEGQEANIKILIEFGANVNARDSVGTTPMISAAIAENIPAMEILKQNGANIGLGDNLGYTPLIHAIRNGKLKSAKWLLENGASVNQGDKEKMTPLMHAVQMKNRRAVQFLMDNGANPNAKDQYGRIAKDFINEYTSEKDKQRVGKQIADLLGD